MKDTALILIDIQQGYDDINYWGGERNNPDAEENCMLILAHFRNLKLPIFHIQHSSFLVLVGSIFFPGGNLERSRWWSLRNHRKKINKRLRPGRGARGFTIDSCHHI